MVLILLGWPLATWSIWEQFIHGRGTPVPTMPTLELLDTGAFALCRNPMTLGTILASLGLGIGIGSPSAVRIALFVGGMLLSYLKLVEEKELEARFEAAYLEDKQRTLFILPHLLSRRAGSRLKLRSEPARNSPPP